MDSDRYLPLAGRAVFALSGDDTRAFLQGIVTNDIDLVSPDKAIYAALLTPQGKFLHDFFVAELDGRLLLETAAARVDDLLKRLRMYRLRAKVEISDETADWQVAALLPGTGKAGSAKGWLGGIAFGDPRHAALGDRAIVPAGTNFAAQGLKPATEADYDSLRLTLGIPGPGELLPEKSMPLECGFDELNGVSFTKGCYVGQEVTARMKHRNLVKKRLFPIDIEGTAAPGAEILADGVTAGEVYSAHDGKGLALLRLDLASRDDLSADGATIRPHKPDWANF
jgi:folate-binding protein YgfZ